MVAATSILPQQSVSILVQAMGEKDRAYVLDSWVKSYQALMPGYAKTWGLGRWGWTQKCAEALVARGRTLVATLEDVPDVILGWACHEPGVLHYVFVRGGPTRRQGIARLLVGECGRIQRITHRPGKNLRQKAHNMGWRYEPLHIGEIDA